MEASVDKEKMENTDYVLAERTTENMSNPSLHA